MVANSFTMQFEYRQVGQCWEVTEQNEIGIGFTDTLTGYGYGAGAYGGGTYGTPRTASGIILQLRTWSLWAYGEWLLAILPAAEALGRGEAQLDGPQPSSLLVNFRPR